MMGAAAAAAAGDFEVVLKREEVSKDDDAASLVHAPRVLFVRLGERFSAGDRVFIRKFFDRRRSSRCLVVIMLNADDLSRATRLNSQWPCGFGPNLSAQNYVSGYTEKHTRTSTVPIECAFAFFTEDTLHPFDRGSDPNKRAVDAIAALLRGSPLSFGQAARKTRRIHRLKSRVVHSPGKGMPLLVPKKTINTQRAMAPKTGARSGTDLAYAHYRRAYRHKRRHDDDRRLAHLRRGDHYARMAAFGIDHAQHPASTLMVGFDPNDPIGEDEAHPADMPLSWTPTTAAQARAMDALLIAELKGDIGTVAYGEHGSDVWAACRDEVTGGVYTVKGRDDPRPTVRRELGLKAAPRDALAVIRSVEDWRESMLMVNSPSGWAYATRPQVFAYHDFMLNTKDAGVTATYANVAYRDWCRERYKSSVARDCSDIMIPDSYFPPVGFLSSWFAVRQNVRFWMRRGESRPSVIETRDSTQGKWFEVRPASLVRDAPIQAVMPKHLARIILGIVEESPDEKWVRTVVERFVGAIDRAVQNAAYSLYPHSTFECSVDAVRRHRREAREAAEAEAAAQKRLQSAKEAKLRAPTAVERTIPWAYSLLGIKVGATREEVEKAYRKATRTYHPDKGGNELDFILVGEAFALIKMTVFGGSLFGVRRRSRRSNR